MSDATTRLLVNLSHGWSPLVLASPVVMGFCAWRAGKWLAHKRESAPEGTHRIAIGIRALSLFLFAASIPLLGISVLHVGCASAVRHESTCRANLKLLALGTLMYAQDNDERLPPAVRWSDSIDPFVKSREVFRCPSALTGASYGLNAAIGGASLEAIIEPASTVLIFEGNSGNRSFAGGEKDVTKNRHSGGSTVAFADGHVKHMGFRNRTSPPDWLWALPDKPSKEHP